jgi:hypothetical protein
MSVAIVLGKCVNLRMAAADLHELAGAANIFGFVKLEERLLELSTEVATLSQQIGSVHNDLRSLLEEVRSNFTRDDDLPDNLLQRIDEALK